MKILLPLMALLVSTSVGFSQQIKNPVTTVVKDVLTRQHKNLVAAVEEMPADKFDFRPTPLQETFGHLTLHITEANNYLCALAAGVPKPKTEELKDTDSKEKLVGAIKASFDFCESALSKTDDSTLGDALEGSGDPKQPRARPLIGMVSNWADHYAAAAMYLRLNGLLPPTAQTKK